MPSVIASYKVHLHLSRIWLVKLSKLVGDNRIQPSDTAMDEGNEPPGAPSDSSDSQLQAMKDRFVKWPWDNNESLYNWVMDAQILPKPKTWTHSDFWWKAMWISFET